MNKNKINLEGNIAVVTGGAQGIGYAVAERMLQSNAHVILWDFNIEANEKAAAALSSLGNVTAVTVDVANWDSVQSAAAKTVEIAGRIDIVVNSAGIAGPTVTVEEYDNDQWRRIIDINLNGTYYVNKSVITGMKERNYGRIINIASVAGKEGNPNASAYSASKAGVIGFTKSLGKELAGFDIAVNSVSPAAARTPIFEQN